MEAVTTVADAGPRPSPAPEPGQLVYDHKLAQGIGRYAAKKGLLDYLKVKASVTTFVGGHSATNRRLNVAEYQQE